MRCMPNVITDLYNKKNVLSNVLKYTSVYQQAKYVKMSRFSNGVWCGALSKQDMTELTGYKLIFSQPLLLETSLNVVPKLCLHFSPSLTHVGCCVET